MCRTDTGNVAPYPHAPRSCAALGDGWIADARRACDAVDDAAPEPCRDCGRPVVWDERLGDYRHLTPGGCFLHSRGTEPKAPTTTDYADARWRVIATFTAALRAERQYGKTESNEDLGRSIESQEAAFGVAKLYGWDCTSDPRWDAAIDKGTGEEILALGIQFALANLRLPHDLWHERGPDPGRCVGDPPASTKEIEINYSPQIVDVSDIRGTVAGALVTLSIDGVTIGYITDGVIPPEGGDLSAWVGADLLPYAKGDVVAALREAALEGRGRAQGVDHRRVRRRPGGGHEEGDRTMSYTTYMEIDTGGREMATVREIGNMTSNVSGMWTKALGFHLCEMQGWAGSECIPHLERALQRMDDPVTLHEYIAKSPSNGWGSPAGARGYLQEILDACRAHPKASLLISR